MRALCSLLRAGLSTGMHIFHMGTGTGLAARRALQIIGSREMVIDRGTRSLKDTRELFRHSRMVSIRK